MTQTHIWTIIVLAFALLLVMLRRYRKGKRWEVFLLMLIPLILFSSYLFIGLFDIDFDTGRQIVRYVIISCLTLGLFVGIWGRE